MHFIEMNFLWFMLIVFVLYWGLGNRKAQNLLLVVASAILSAPVER